MNVMVTAKAQKKLQALARTAADRLANRAECPECGDVGPHDDNGRTGEELSYCCRECGMHFDADQVPDCGED